MRRRLAPLAAIPAALVLAAPAGALPTPSPPTTPPPKPVAAKMSLRITSGRVDRKRRYQLTGDNVHVRGTIRPFVSGEKVRVELFRGRKRVGHRIVRVRKGKHGTGRFEAKLRVYRVARFSVIARHVATVKQKAGKSRRKRFRAIGHRVRSHESKRLLQISLRGLAFVSPLNGHLDEGTQRAILAYRKVNRYSRNGYPSNTVFRRAFHHNGGFRLRHRHPGRHVEADLSRQVIVLTRDGRPDQIYTVSSGKPSTPTIQGTFRFYRKDPGYNSEQMYYSNYFHGGYAVHGYPDVPATYPASHGCIRLPIPDAYRVYRSIRLGEKIYVYS